jgi:two-component system sensor histidine kinase/response regulator
LLYKNIDGTGLFCLFLLLVFQGEMAMARVLLVEDEEQTRKTYQKILSRMGHEVFLAGDAQEARSVISSEEDLDVALVDRILPGKEDGLAVLRFIQVCQPLCQAVLVTGYPNFDSASEALRANAFDYLTKPVETARLSQVIDAAFAEKTAQKQKMLEAERSKEGYAQLKSKQEILRHDMRSLLVGIVGFANLLMDKTSLNDTQMEYCKQIRQYGIQLENMVNTYLNISDLEQKTSRLDKAMFNVFDIIIQSRNTLHFLADEKNVAIAVINNKKMYSIDDVLAFQGNRMYLQNAIDNLLKNAIEASPPDKRVKIKVKDTPKRIAISIHNWGAVPEDVQPVFFEKYATSGKKNGFGLGTYVAKLVADEHGGQISLHSSEDEGTEVLMTLPFPKPH